MKLNTSSTHNNVHLAATLRIYLVDSDRESYNVESLFLILRYMTLYSRIPAQQNPCNF
jgi:hypothetical protein